MRERERESECEEKQAQKEGHEIGVIDYFISAKPLPSVENKKLHHTRKHSRSSSPSASPPVALSPLFPENFLVFIFLPFIPPPSRSTSVDFPFPSLPLIISFVFSPSADLWSTDHGPQCYADGAVRRKGRELGWKVGSRCHCRSSICCPRFVAVYSCRPAVVAGYICCSRLWFAVCGFLQVSVARAVGVSFRPAPLFARLIAGLSAARGVAPVSAAAK